MYASTTTNLYNLNYAGRSHDFPLVAPGYTPLIKGFLLKKAKKDARKWTIRLTIEVD